jgi:hypothetical protein
MTLFFYILQLSEAHVRSVTAGRRFRFFSLREQSQNLVGHGLPERAHIEEILLVFVQGELLMSVATNYSEARDGLIHLELQ